MVRILITVALLCLSGVYFGTIVIQRVSNAHAAHLAALGSELEKATVSAETRPNRCREFYQPGNQDIDSPWKRCMGVGRR